MGVNMKRIASRLLLPSLAFTAAQAQNPIQYVVVIFQENRTSDNLFHGLPGADIANTGVNSKGQIIPLKPIPLVNNYDLGHSHKAFVQMYDKGRMDGADKVGILCNKGAKNCPPPNPQFKYVNPSDVAPYFQMAEQYTFADRMFQTNQGASFPAHQFILAGTSAPTASSNLFAAEDVIGFEHANWDMGCAGSPKVLVRMIDPAGDESQKMFPCFEHPTLTDLLDNQNLTW